MDGPAPAASQHTVRLRVALNFASVGARRGGAEAYIGMLARALVAKGHEVHVLAASIDPGELPVEARVHRIVARTWPGFSWLWPYQFAAASDRELSRQAFDLVIGFGRVWRQDICLALNGCHRGALHASLARFRTVGGRALWWLGKHLDPKQYVCRSIERRQYRPSNQPLVIAPSRRVADDFSRWYCVDPRQIAVVPLGIELDNTRTDAESREAFRRRVGLKPTDVAILFAARNYALKGLAPLLEAFARVARLHPQARLVVCGQSRDAAYRRQARRLGLAGRVDFLGFVHDARECFAGVDVFAMPTFYDACSLVVLESLAAGVPVITTRANGAAELVSEGIDGFVIDTPWNLDQLSARLGQLVGSGELRARMGDDARRGASRLSIEASVQAMMDLISSRMGAPNSAGRCAA